MITLVWLAIFSSGCFGGPAAPQRPVNPPTPVLVKVNSPTAAAGPERTAAASTPLPQVVQNTPTLAAFTATPTLSIGELLAGVVIGDLRVGMVAEADPGQGQEQPCIFSPDNFYTCVVNNRLMQTIRVSFTLKPPGDLSTADLERLHASMEVVVYPYRTTSRYTPAPPLVDESIQEMGGGVWGTDFRIHSPDRAFSFFLMAEGRSLAGSNLYLVPPEPFVPAPLAEDESEN